MRRRYIASLTSLCLLLSALGGPLFAAQAAAGQPAPQPRYRIKAGDLVDVTVLPQGAPYNRQLKVLPDGTITYPEIGEIVVAGKTIQELTDVITAGLVKAGLRNPRVTISVQPGPGPGGEQGAVGRVVVLGQVRQPGAFNLGPNTRLIEAIAEAGGPTEKADLGRVQITRGDLTTLVVDLTGAPAPGAPTANIPLRDGDTIVVPEIQRSVLTGSILGEVQKPGPYSFAPGATLLDLLKESGGPLQTADLSRAQLRRVGQAPEVIDLHRLWVDGDPTFNRRLVQDDILVIPSNVAKAYILGAVSQPKVLSLHGGETLLDVLIAGGSPTPDANLSQVTVSRSGAGGTRTVRRVNLKNIGSGGDTSAMNMPIAAGDVVVVPASKHNELNALTQLTMITTILGMLSTLKSLFNIGNSNNNGTVTVRRQR